MPLPRCSANCPKRWRLSTGPALAASTVMAIGAALADGAWGAAPTDTRPARPMLTIETALPTASRERHEADTDIDDTPGRGHRRCRGATDRSGGKRRERMRFQALASTFPALRAHQAGLRSQSLTATRPIADTNLGRQRGAGPVESRTTSSGSTTNSCSLGTSLAHQAVADGAPDLVSRDVHGRQRRHARTATASRCRTRSPRRPRACAGREPGPRASRRPPSRR